MEDGIWPTDCCQCQIPLVTLKPVWNLLWISEVWQKLAKLSLHRNLKAYAAFIEMSKRKLRDFEKSQAVMYRDVWRLKAWGQEFKAEAEVMRLRPTIWAPGQRLNTSGNVLCKRGNLRSDGGQIFRYCRPLIKSNMLNCAISDDLWGHAFIASLFSLKCDFSYSYSTADKITAYSVERSLCNSWTCCY